MVEGAVEKYLAEVTLLGQPFVKDDNLTVEKLLKRRSTPRVNRFPLFVVGEGIEKKKADFARGSDGAAGSSDQDTSLDMSMPR